MLLGGRVLPFYRLRIEIQAWKGSKSVSELKLRYCRHATEAKTLSEVIPTISHKKEKDGCLLFIINL